MLCEELFAKIDELKDEYIKVWVDVGNIESPTHHKPGVDAVGDFFAEMAKKRGWQVEYCYQEVAGNALCITMNPDVDAPAVVLSGHMDTVHPVGSFGTPAVRMDEEKIYGPGVLDCKSGGVSSFLAMDALDQIGFRSRPVKLILQSDEEVNSSCSKGETIKFMVEKAKGAVAFLNAESIEGNKVVLSRKGILRLRYDITGKAVHAARCDAGASAVAEAAYKIVELEKLKDKNGLTCNCGLISGGSAANAVPESCTFTADIRFATAEEYNYVVELTQKIADTVYVSGCSCQVTRESYRPPMVEEDRNYQLLDAINGIYRECGLPELIATKSYGGSDAAYITEAGIPCICSIGPGGGGIHSIKEFAYLNSLPEAAKRLAAVAMCL